MSSNRNAIPITHNKRYRNVSKSCYVGVAEHEVPSALGGQLGYRPVSLGSSLFYSVPGSIWYDGYGLHGQLDHIPVRCLDAKELDKLVTEKGVKPFENKDGTKGFFNPTHIFEDVTSQMKQLETGSLDMFAAGMHIEDLKKKAAEADDLKKKTALLEAEHAAMRAELDELKNAKTASTVASIADAVLRKK